MISEKHQFGRARALKYDDKIRLLSPGYETLHELTLNLLERSLPEKAEILIVGAGTGMDILTCGRNRPGWRFTAIEPSTEMLELCHENIAHAKMTERVSFFKGYVEELPGDNFYDAATSIYVSHFIPSENKGKYFAAISSRLKRKSPLIIADMFGDKDSSDFKMIFESWKKYYFSIIGDLTEAQKSFDYIEKDFYLIAENSLAKLLEQNGFSDFYRFFQTFMFGSWCCQKA